MKYESDYLPADKYVEINGNDVDLKPIILKLPKPPSLKYIEGYGLPVEEQRFSRLAIPRKLIDLEAEAILKTKEDMASNKNNVVTLLKIQKKFWELFNSRQKQLKNEIEFIRRVWWFRLNGFWFFNRGKPTYLTGRHFFYLNFFDMDTKTRRPDYRDCDRREYVFKEYCWTSTETFEKIDEHGFAIPESDGSYKMIDLGRRICFGEGQPKNRRRGNTSKAVSDGIEVTSRTIGTDGFGIQSYTEDSAKKHFKGKVIPAWNSLPIWLKPLSVSGRTSDEIKLESAKNDYEEDGLGTVMNYATTASSKAFDGQKRIFLLTDEEGKTSVCSVSERWSVNKHTLAQGDGMIIHGYSSHPSTVDQLTDGSGDYQYLMSSSTFYKRVKSKGQTPSGLFRIFIPAQDGLEGFVDSYGYSVTGNIKEYQKKEGFNQTAEDYLQGDIDLLQKEDTPEAKKKLREHRQLYPMKYSDSWMGTAGELGFDIQKIDRQITVLKRENEVVRGNLKWVDGVFGGDVYLEEDNERGKFIFSKMPFDHCSNKKVKVGFFNPFDQKWEEHWRPMNPGVITIGADPFRIGGKKEERMGASIGKRSGNSDGGIMGLWNYDESLDGGKPKSEWESFRFIFSYRYRSSNTDTYNDDVLKSAIFTGGLIYPETNVSHTYEYIIKKGFGAYLLFDIDKFTGKMKDKPGIDSLERSKQDLFNALIDYIDFRSHKEQHLDFLLECKNIGNIDQMRFFDLVAASGVALLGAKSSYADRLSKMENNNHDLQDFLWT